MTTDADIQRLQGSIRDIPDFPQAGILFKDITPALADPDLFKISLQALIDTIDGQRIDKVVGIDARGFIFGAAIADRLNAGFIPMRKKGKLPHNTHEIAYSLEYGEAIIEVHEDAIAPGEKVFLVDDLLATGGTAEAAIRLINKLQGDLVAASFLIELAFLEGRARLEALAPVHAVLVY